jgi:hypothetical protein
VLTHVHALAESESHAAIQNVEVFDVRTDVFFAVIVSML